MVEYKIVNLNPNMHITQKKDFNEAEETLNSWIKEGWKLDQVVSPNNGLGTLVAILYKG